MEVMEAKISKRITRLLIRLQSINPISILISVVQMSISKQKMLFLRTQDSTGLNKFQLWNKSLFQLMKPIKKGERKGPKEQEQQTNRFNWVESLKI